MNEQTAAYRVKGAGQFKLAEDNHTVIIVFDGEEEQLPLAVPLDQIWNLISLLVMATDKANPRGKMALGKRMVLDVDWWEMMPAVDGDHVLGLRVPGTGFLDFRLHPSVLAGMRDYLQTLDLPQSASEPGKLLS